VLYDNGKIIALFELLFVLIAVTYHEDEYGGLLEW
jgi:hypothetical protein